MTGPVIEPTDEMKAAFRAAQGQRAAELVAEGAPLGAHDILDRGLTAVFALLARDYTITPKHTPAQQCGSCGAWYDPPAVHTCAQCPACTSPYTYHRFVVSDGGGDARYCGDPWHDADAVTSGTYTNAPIPSPFTEAVIALAREHLSPEALADRAVHGDRSVPDGPRGFLAGPRLIRCGCGPEHTRDCEHGR